MRNQLIIDVEHKPDDPINLCLAFHDDLENSKGTGDMVRRAKAAGIPVKVVLSSAALAAQAGDA